MTVRFGIVCLCLAVGAFAFNGESVNSVEAREDFSCDEKGYLEYLSKWSVAQKSTSRDVRSEEFKKRLGYFVESCEKIHEWNAKKKYRMEFTFYADWHVDEFEELATSKQRYSGVKSPVPSITPVYNNTNYRYLMPSMDPCDENAELRELISKPQNCSVSWAFAITNSIEYAIKKMYFEEYDQIVEVSLSAQELIDCVGKEHGVVGKMCDGMPLAWGFDYVYENGIAYSEYYPHTNVEGECLKVNDEHKYHIAGYEKPSAYNKLGLFDLLMKGPVAVTMGLDLEFFQYYRNDGEEGPYFNTGYWRPSVNGVVVEYSQYAANGESEVVSNPFFAVETRLRGCDSMVFRLPILESANDANIGGIAGFAIRPIVLDKIPVKPTSKPTVKPTVVPTVAPTQAPTTQPPTTQAPTTQAPTTQAPTTQPPTTQPPTTQAPTTQAPTTQAPTTQAPTTQPPTTQPPTTQAPTTQPPTTQAPTTQPPTTQPPTTQPPTTQPPTTQAPTTQAPTTQAPTTQPPTTQPPTTQPPTTQPPTTQPPTTQPPTTQPPTTQPPTTQPPTTQAPTTQPPTTQPPTTQPPTTQPPTTQAPTTQPPTTQPPTTQAPTTQPPTTQAPTTQPPTTQAPTTQPPTTQPPTTQAPTTQAPTTQPPTTQPPTTQAPTTQPPTTQAPTPTPTPTPEPWFPIYDPFIFGDNCNYEVQETCYEEVISGMDVFSRYLSIRNAYPSKALKHTRVLALSGMTLSAFNLFHESLSRQEKNPAPVDMYFYSDSKLDNYVDGSMAIPLISLSEYTRPSRIVFGDGSFKREGMAAVLQWMVNNRYKGYFQNLEYFQISGHKAAAYEGTAEEALALQNQIVANLHTMCTDKMYFPRLNTLNFNGNAYDEFNDGFDTALRSACNRMETGVTIRAFQVAVEYPPMCSTTDADNYCDSVSFHLELGGE
ncbi:hypothetical protein WA588_002035 [Blastocystis sp. NMH]